MKSNKKVRALYDILGIERDATKEEIKKAYRKLANEHHPDHNDGKESPEFIDITKAYKILSDDEKRKEYDETGYVKDNIHDQKEVAIEILMGWLEHCLNDDKALKTNVVDRLIAMAKSNVNQCRHRIKLTTKRMKKLRKVIKRFRYKGKSRDFVTMCIQNNINKLMFNMQQAQYQIETDKLIIEMLTDYEYDYNLDPDDEENEAAKGSQTLGNIFDFNRKPTDVAGK